MTKFFESSYFSLSRKILLTLTTITLITSIGLLIWGTIPWLKSVDETSKINKKVTVEELDTHLEKYQQILKEKTERANSKKTSSSNQNKSQDLFSQERDIAAEGEATKEYITRFEPILKRILANLEQFASTMEQPAPSGDGLKQALEDTKIQLANIGHPDLWWGILDKLEAETTKLVTKIPELKQIPTSDPTYVRWDEFLEYFLANAIKEIKQKISEIEEAKRQEKEKIDAAKMKDMLSKTAGLTFVSFGGMGIMIFVLMTILLVVIRIELHLRKTTEAK